MTPDPSPSEARAHRARLASLRRVAWVLPIALAGFAINDLLVAPPGTNLGGMLAARAAWGAALVGFAAILHGGDPSYRQLRALAAALLFSGGLSFSALSILRGGIGAIVGSGILIPSVGVGPLLPQRFLPALLTGLAMPAGFLVGMQAATALGIAAGWDDPVAVETYAAWIANGIGSAFLGAWISRTLYALQIEVLDARDIGRYRLIRRLGTGGMGEVWAAWHQTLRREVALKLLVPSDGRLSPEAVARFEREVQATTRLSHPNTIRIFDYGVSEEGVPYYAMELLEGETLAARVQRSGAVPPREALGWGRQVARALAEAHALGIVHRDVKPENLFLTRVGGEDVVRLLDFGIARTAEDPGLTRAGTVTGTPAYLAPELLGRRPADARSDVYALGVTLYFALTGGRLPFEDEDLRALVAAILTGNFELPSKKVPLPGPIDALISACLDRDPRARPPDGAALAERMTAILADLHDDAPPVALPSVAREQGNETMTMHLGATPAPSGRREG